MSDITLTMPDGAKRPIKPGTTGADVARAISPSLLKRTVAMTLDGVLADLACKRRAAVSFAAHAREARVDEFQGDAVKGFV